MRSARAPAYINSLSTCIPVWLVVSEPPDSPARPELSMEVRLRKKLITPENRIIYAPPRISPELMLLNLIKKNPRNMRPRPRIEYMNRDTIL